MKNGRDIVGLAWLRYEPTAFLHRFRFPARPDDDAAADARHTDRVDAQFLKCCALVSDRVDGHGCLNYEETRDPGRGKA
jgi:hypothetical protein